MDTYADQIERGAERIDAPLDEIGTKAPASTWLFIAAGSVLASMALYFSGKRQAALFVGLWAPTVLHMGTYNKLLRIQRGNAPHVPA